MAATTSSGKKRKVSAPTIFSSGNSSSNSSNNSSNNNSNCNSKNNSSNGNHSSTSNISLGTNMDRSETDTETASKYIERLQQSDRAAAQNNFKRISSVEKRTTGRGGTEVKISFGPSRPPSSSGASGGKAKHRNSAGINIHNNNNSNINNIHSSNPSPAAAAASMAAMMGGVGNCGSVSFGDLDLEALKEKAAAAAAGQKTFRNKHGLPCTEAEMKALMSMFVEIMGMSMNNNNNNNNNNGSKGGNASGGYSNGNNSDSRRGSGAHPGSSHKNGGGISGVAGVAGGPVFSFGANPMDASSLAAMAAAASGASPAGMMPDHMAAATAGFFADGASWEALRRTYAAAEQMAAAEEDDEDEDEDEESFENRELTFEEVEFLLHHRKQKEEAAKLASQFASGDWESLEQVAINDHLLSSEADERERKAAKKREKKQRRKAKLKEEAAQKAAEAAQKKREKAIVSWRSRVVSACQSNEIAKLDGLLQESPLRKLMEEQSHGRNKNSCDGTENDSSGTSVSTSCIIPHLEFFLPNSVAKNRAHVERGIEARLRLAEYVLHSELLLAFKPLRTGRTALHTACFNGDVKFLQLLFDKVEMYEPSEGKGPIPSSFLDLTCDESGWSPLHYAAVSGSSEVLELLLAKGSNLAIRTDVTHTWRESDGRGLTPRELVQCIQAGNYEEVIETHGLALQEMTNAFFNHHQERRLFLKKLERVQQRLSSVEKHGYAPITSKDRADSITESEAQTGDANLNPSETSSSRNKKKKKKKKKQNGKDAESRTSGTAGGNPNNSASARSNSIEVEQKEDPLVTALLGMGFNENQIMAAVKACGGTHRATADDLVTWILGQGESEESTTDSPKNSDSNEGQRQESAQFRTEDSRVSQERDQRKQELEAARKQEETARRLATKREEARRRNREWNNREQARQEKEAKAKAQVAQKLYNASRPSAPVTGTQARVPNGIHKGAPAAGNAISRLKGSTQQPKLPKGTAGNKWGVPTILANPKPFPAPPMQSKKSAPKPKSAAAPTLPTASEQPALPMSSFFTSIDDDKTVSSFGSNRGMSVSSKEFVPLAPQPSVPPPGFSPNSAQPVAAPLKPPPAASVPEDARGDPFSVKTRQGEIRATAKAFVPSFTIPGIVDANAPLQRDFSTSTELSGSQNSESHGVGFPPGILPQHGGSTVGHSSILGSSLTNSFENAPSMTSAAGGTILPSTSFVGGSKTEEPPMGISFGFGQGDSAESDDIGGSRLLNSISRNRSAGATSIWGDNQGIPSLESTLQPSFFGDGTLGDSDVKKSNLWDSVPAGAVGNPSLPNVSGQGSIW